MTEILQTFAPLESLNFTSVSATSPPVALNKSVRTIGIVVGSIDIVLGSIGNLMTIVAILGNKQLQNTFHIFIVSLCFVDFLTASVMMPLNVTSYVLQRWPLIPAGLTCAIQAYSYYCCGYSSIVCLLVITVNRYVGIIHSKDYTKMFSKRRCFAIVFFSWIFAPLVMSPIFFFGRDGRLGYGWMNAYSLCAFRTDIGNEHMMPYMNFIRVLFQAVPLFIMIALYGIIFHKVHSAGRDVLRMSVKSTQSCDLGEKRRFSMPDMKDEKSSGDGWSIRSDGEKERRDGDGKEKKCDRLQISDPREPSSRRGSTNYLRNSDESDPLTPESRSHHSVDSRNGSICKNGSNKSPNGSRQEFVDTHDRVKNQSSAGRNVSNIPRIQIDRSRITKKWSKRQRSALSLSNRSSSRRMNRNGPKRNSVFATMRRRRRSVDRRLLQISVTICVVFMILFLPSVIINLLPKSGDINPNVHRYASIITWLNSCVNPIIYCFMNPKLRSQYIHIFYSIGHTLLPNSIKPKGVDHWKDSFYSSSFRRARSST